MDTSNKGGRFMLQFKVGDKVVINSTDIKGKIINKDTLTKPVPIYYVLFENGEIEKYFPQALKRYVEVAELLSSGVVLTEDIFKDNATIIRTIRYETVIFYVKEVDNQIIEVKELY